MRREPFALYVHIPFCSRKCPYCDFNTYAVEGAPEQLYTEALCRELDYYAEDPIFQGRQVSSVFFGGGTPSLFSPKAIGCVLQAIEGHFPIIPCSEITLEANPGGVSLERLQGYRAIGINRLSFGVQSFSAKTLTLLGREHSPEQAMECVALALAAGISNVSIDIIFGVSGQDVSHVQRDLEVAFRLPIKHLSTYALSIEPGTPFFQRQQRGVLSLPPEDAVVEMMYEIPRHAALQGFNRYEISNYAKPGFESKHNSAYWRGVDYLGIGAGAHSYVLKSDMPDIDAVRWTTLAQPLAYMKVAGTTAVVSWREDLDQKGLQFEFFYLGLRRSEGIDLHDFLKHFGAEALHRYELVLQDLQSEGFVHRENDTVTLTAQGIVLSDSVYERLA